MTHEQPKVHVAESAFDAMVQAARQAHPNETGGILIGITTQGIPWVTQVVEIPPTNPQRARYRIPGGATPRAVLDARANDPRLGYLGDWHTHPVNIGPSSTDLASLAFISVTHPLQPNPTSIVVRRVEERYELDARRITHVRPRPCVIEFTGNLPTPEERS